MKLKDDDDDELEIKAVDGFGEPMLALNITMHNWETAGVNLDLPMTKKLKKFLEEFIEEHCGP